METRTRHRLQQRMPCQASSRMVATECEVRGRNACAAGLLLRLQLRSSCAASRMRAWCMSRQGGKTEPKVRISSRLFLHMLLFIVCTHARVGCAFIGSFCCTVRSSTYYSSTAVGTVRLLLLPGWKIDGPRASYMSIYGTAVGVLVGSYRYCAWRNTVNLTEDRKSGCSRGIETETG